MLRTTALLIVVVFAGAPAVALACGLSCAHTGAGGHHTAEAPHHDGAASHAAEHVSQAPTVGSCHDVLATTPFLTKSKQTESRSFTWLPGILEFPVPLAVVGPGTTMRWKVPRAQPSGGPVLRLALRI